MIVKNKFLWTFCVLAFFGWAKADEEVTLEIPQGTLKGVKTTTVLNGKPYYSFKGIPYAKPNVGLDKFRDPLPADPWTGVLDATQHRSTCVFYCQIRQGLFGQEDCLFLNVYTPEVNKDAKKAVMVWIHPGGWSAGSGDDDIQGPDFLVEKDVVLVTFNYRTGPLGFLSTGDANAPGNAGLKDQVMVLKWVRDNIQNFGGCPKKVTIFGQSCGASSVQYHMLSPMSQGLFRSGIAESGSVFAGWAYTQTPRETAFKFGEHLGVKTSDTTELVNKLKEFSAKELVDANVALTEPLTPLNGYWHLFVPTAEPDAGQEVFLPAHPWEMLKSGKIADVPLMTGLLTDEASILKGFLADTKMLDENLDKFLPYELNITDDAMRKDIAMMLKKFYFNGKSTADNPEKAIELLSDVWFTYGSSLSAELINERNSAPVYEYLFSYYMPFGFMKALFGTEQGVAHGDDMVYLFYSNAFKNKPEPGSPFEKMTDIMTDLWTNFAKELNPTPNMDGAVKVMWEPKGKDDNYLEINVEPAMKKGMFKDRVNLWAGIYKNVLGDYYSKLFG